MTLMLAILAILTGMAYQAWLLSPHSGSSSHAASGINPKYLKCLFFSRGLVR